MDKFKEALTNVFTQLKGNLGLYTTIIMTISYHLVFERDFECTCKPQSQQTHCFLHLLLPAGLLWILLLWIDKSFQRACSMLVQKFCCSSKCCSKCCPEGSSEGSSKGSSEGSAKGSSKGSSEGSSGWTCVLLRTVLVRFVHALCVGVIWIAVVLLDGDWFVCCRNDGSQTQAQVACKEDSERTPEEESIAADLKSQSRVSGLYTLLTVAALASIVSCFKVCWYKKKEVELTDAVLEDGQNLVLRLMREAAEDKLTKDVKAYIEKEQWSECSGAVEDLINKMTAKPPKKGPSKQNTETLKLLGEQNAGASGSAAQTGKA